MDGPFIYLFYPGSDLCEVCKQDSRASQIWEPNTLNAPKYPLTTANFNRFMIILCLFGFWCDRVG